MSIPPACPPILDFFGIPLVIEPSQGQLSGDAGLLPIRQFDERIGLTRANACGGARIMHPLDRKGSEEWRKRTCLTRIMHTLGA